MLICISIARCVDTECSFTLWNHSDSGTAQCLYMIVRFGIFMLVILLKSSLSLQLLLLLPHHCYPTGVDGAAGTTSVIVVRQVCVTHHLIIIRPY